jgi:thiol-disulfide isomerase/thioredoxin
LKRILILNKISRISIIIALILVAGVFYWVRVNKPEIPKLGNFQDVGSIPLSKAQFKDEKGNLFTLSDFKGKLIILHSWATWCEPCLEEIPEMLEFYKKFQDKNVVLIALHREPLRGNAQIPGLSVYFDAGNALAQDMMMIGGIPSTLFISPNGTTQGIILGKSPWKSAQMHLRIESMLKEVK